MPVDYSKWDALELSDDSDIEVHPNVDKRSFIRAKQNQIHQQRSERKNKIATYKYEQQINDGLIKRINALITALQSHTVEAKTRELKELVFMSVMESTDPQNDNPPPRPEGIHPEQNELPTYSKMIAMLVDQVQEKIDKEKPDDRFEATIAEVKVHKLKVEKLQEQLLGELNTLEKEEGTKITSASYHTGFDSSSVAKSDNKKKTTKTEKVQAVEVLNPKALGGQGHEPGTSSGADGDVDEPKVSDDDSDEEHEASEIGKKFALIKVGDYRQCLDFISKNPSVVAEKETDGLLVMAFNLVVHGGQEDHARQCVHQALLLQYCRALGRDGVGLFFKRITTPGHQAQKVFFDDVNSTFARIKARGKELAKHNAQNEADASGGVEQIQLHAVEPGTTINITIPPESSNDPAEIEARKLFDAFPPGLQRALGSGSLDEVNKVLGKMSVEEAEEVVGKLSEGGMLQVEEQIIDATTEEGQAALRDFEAQEKAALTQETADQPEKAGDPE